MDHAERSDEELVTLAREGWDSAFAVLVRRHTGAVLAAVDDDPDPDRALERTFAAAMTRLHEDAAGSDTRAWLVGISGGRSDAEPVDVDDERLDRLWARLAERWPDGKRPIHLPHSAVWALAIVLTVALSAGLPWLLLGRFGEEPSLQELRAFPIDAERSEPGEDLPEEIEEPLPTFEFPVPPEDLPETPPTLDDTGEQPDEHEADAETADPDGGETSETDEQEPEDSEPEPTEGS